MWQSMLGSLGGGILGAWGSRKAGKAHGKAVKKAISYMQMEINRLRTELAPYRDLGVFGANELRALLGAGPGEFEEDPGYQFRLGEGTKALERGAAARGGLLSGAQGKALTRFGQELGTQEYQNFLNRYYQKLQSYEPAIGYGLQASQIGTAGMGSVPELLAHKGAVQGAYMQSAVNALPSGFQGMMGGMGGGGMGGGMGQVNQLRASPFGRRMSLFG